MPYSGKMTFAQWCDLASSLAGPGVTMFERMADGTQKWTAFLGSQTAAQLVTYFGTTGETITQADAQALIDCFTGLTNSTISAPNKAKVIPFI